MRIIISPAKKMNVDTDSLPCQALPVLLHRTEQLLELLQAMDDKSLQLLWNCSNKLAALNIERLRSMNLRHSLTPAILAYEGLQYQHMCPNAFSRQEFDYLQQCLRILSGFYGVLKPFDGVTPYRLEMQAKLAAAGHSDLYGFWGPSIADEVTKDCTCVINLASKEYSLSLSRHLPEDLRFITCTFGEEKNGKIIEKGSLCKMARGEMVRFMAENSITNPEEIKNFSRLDFQFSANHSTDENFVFILSKKKKPQ